MALLRMPCVPAQSGWKKSSSLDNGISSVISSSSAVSFCKLGSGYVAQSDCGCVTKVRTSGIAGIACRVRTAGSEDGAERDIGGMAASVSRRAVLWGLVAAQGLVMEREVARAGVPNYRKYVDRLDGYTFSYPAGWIEVRGAGADVFFRDPVNLDENLLVEISSPSSSKFKGVEDLGTPEQASKKVLQQYLTEFMSTRIGVRREANVTATKSRVGDDGRLYYEVEVVASSYANNNQLAVMPESRVAKLEWSRRYLSVLGVENNRLYQLRLQVPENVAELEEKDLRQIMNSFGVLKLDA